VGGEEGLEGLELHWWLVLDFGFEIEFYYLEIETTIKINSLKINYNNDEKTLIPVLIIKSEFLYSFYVKIGYLFIAFSQTSFASSQIIHENKLIWF